MGQKLFCIFNNIDKPFINIKLIENSGAIKEENTFFFADHEIEDGLPVDDTKIVDFINSVCPKGGSVHLVLSCTEVFAYHSRMPKVSSSKALKLAQNDVKAIYPNNSFTHHKIESMYENAYGFVFTTYFIPNAILDRFTSIFKKCDKKLESYDILPSFMSTCAPISDSEFALAYRINGVNFITLNFGSGMFAFKAFEKIEMLKTYLLEMISKHTIDFERKEISNIYTNIDYEEFISEFGARKLESEEFNYKLAIKRKI